MVFRHRSPELGHRRILSKLNGNAIDIAGGSTAPGTPVDSFPVKLTGAENQVWQVVGGDFPFPASTVPYDPGWGNGNVNYVMDGETEPLVNVSATIDFSEDHHLCKRMEHSTQLLLFGGRVYGLAAILHLRGLQVMASFTPSSIPGHRPALQMRRFHSMLRQATSTPRL